MEEERTKRERKEEEGCRYRNKKRGNREGRKYWRGREKVKGSIKKKRKNVDRIEKRMNRGKAPNKREAK